MKTVGIISMSPVEISAIKAGFGAAFPDEEFHFQVFDTPMDSSLELFADEYELYKETSRRIQRVKEKFWSISKPDFYVTFLKSEEYIRDRMAQFACVVVQTQEGVEATSMTENFVASLFDPSDKVLIFREEKEDGVFLQHQELYQDAVHLALLHLPSRSLLDSLMA